MPTKKTPARPTAAALADLAAWLDAAAGNAEREAAAHTDHARTLYCDGTAHGLTQAARELRKRFGLAPAQSSPATWLDRTNDSSLLLPDGRALRVWKAGRARWNASIAGVRALPVHGGGGFASRVAAKTVVMRRSVVAMGGKR